MKTEELEKLREKAERVRVAQLIWHMVYDSSLVELDALELLQALGREKQLPIDSQIDLLVFGNEDGVVPPETQKLFPHLHAFIAVELDNNSFSKK
jgi:hypothetical protein